MVPLLMVGNYVDENGPFFWLITIDQQLSRYILIIEYANQLNNCMSR